MFSDSRSTHHPIIRLGYGAMEIHGIATGVKNQELENLEIEIMGALRVPYPGLHRRVYSRRSAEST
jgi:hypothetical protein